MKPDKIDGLVEALHHWLSFQILCGRDELLSESYLNQPTGEYLLHAAGSSRLKTEHDHPKLNKQAKKGRRRQIDFCLLGRDSLALTTAIELKWVAHTTLDKQRIIDDLLRLECLTAPKGRHIHRYLIIAGRIEGLKGGLFNASMNSNKRRIGFIKGILSTDKGETISVVYDCLEKEQRGLFDRFEDNYGSPIPKQFSTILIHSRESSDIGVYCWRIQSSSNRQVVEREHEESSAKTADPP